MALDARVASRLREQMVARQLADRGIEDARVLAAMHEVPRHPFVSADLAEAALLARLVREVVAVERDPELAMQAASRLAELGITNVSVHAGDGTLGWPERAPFDAILVSAGGPHVPPALEAQLAPGGRLVIPVGARTAQSLLRVSRRADGELAREDLGVVQFVPLVGAEGFER